MSDKIFLNARYAFRSDTLENWQNINPVLEKGEPAIVSDGIDGEWLKIGDGINTFNDLEWKKGPQGERGADGKDGKDATTDQIYNSESQNAQSGKAVAEAFSKFACSVEFQGAINDAMSSSGYATNEQVENIHKHLIEKELAEVKVKRVEFSNYAIITVEDNTEYTATEPITNLVIAYPHETDFICSFNFTLASEGNISISIDESDYIGGVPTFANGETWELNIKNRVVVGGLVE